MKLGTVSKSLILATALSALATAAIACTPMGVGKNASADGSVMVSHTCDGWYDQRIQIVKGGKHKPGTMLEIWGDPCVATRPDKPQVKMGVIPQAPETYTYFNVGYPFMNEKGVVMGEFTWSGRDEVASPKGMFYIANLEQLGLARAATAKEAVKVMGKMAEKYGYCDGGETLIVGDGNEAWVFEVCGGGLLWTPESGKPGAHWVATRIPDDGFFVGANRARTQVVDFNDKENVMTSTDLTALPEEMGWWKKGTPFNFEKIFNPEPYGYPFYQSRREWRALSLVAPSKKWELRDDHSQYPMFVTPDKKLTVQDLMKIYGDHLEGTPYDLTKDKAAGPFGNPTRWQVAKDQKPKGREGEDWERSIALFRCSYSFISQSRADLPEPVSTVLWFGEDAPDTTVYVPIYCGVTTIPAPWTRGDRAKFDRNSAWWAFNLVNNWANLRWDAMFKDIQAKRATYESKFFADQGKVEAEAVRLYKSSPKKAVQYLTDYTCKSLNTVEKGWWDYAFELIGKYYDGGMIGEKGNFVVLGYPQEYLKSVDFGGTSAKDQKTLAK